MDGTLLCAKSKELIVKSLKRGALVFSTLQSSSDSKDEAKVQRSLLTFIAFINKCEVFKIEFLQILHFISKWLEIFLMNSTNAHKTIEQLCKVFGTFGHPQFLVVDNGSSFNSEQFHTFCKLNGMQVINITQNELVVTKRHCPQ